MVRTDGPPDPWAPPAPTASPAPPGAAAPPHDATAWAEPITQPLPAILAAPADTTPGRRPDGPTHGRGDGRWSLVDVLAGFGLVLVLSAALSWPFGVFEGIPREVSLLVAGFLPIWLGLTGAAWWASRRHGTGNLRRDLGLVIKPVDLAIGLGVGLGMRVVSVILTLAISALQGGVGRGNLESVTSGIGDVALVLNLVVGATLIAPVVEELFFRGLLIRSSMSSLQRRLTPAQLTDPARQARCRWITVGLSSVLFVVLHLPELTDPYSVLPLGTSLLLMGGVCALLTMHTGRLGSAIVAHMTFNGVAAVVTLTQL
ncbi:CPBP family intramembrane metalloprotease [Nakamurella sp. YIM 132087]|uniref:CPBP family intramembrane metalloprotease n=1 Tax=Nakamurella alba TaxID=2665158 RepID=A0A7K1FMD6_9ACTN|nr:type II CAAX endopeptidase family protein [Nakamurella alba]MTD15278.1 CPBP family intramembrane metalloprotease [Nakamurella alba]